MSARVTRHKPFRGQGAKLPGGCRGKLVITLSGQQGVGKSLLVKLLKTLLPLTMVDTVAIIEVPAVESAEQSFEES